MYINNIDKLLNYKYLYFYVYLLLQIKFFKCFSVNFLCNNNFNDAVKFNFFKYNLLLMNYGVIKLEFFDA